RSSQDDGSTAILIFHAAPVPWFSLPGKGGESQAGSSGRPAPLSLRQGAACAGRGVTARASPLSVSSACPGRSGAVLAAGEGGKGRPGRSCFEKILCAPF